jgi:hypothetical protein
MLRKAKPNLFCDNIFLRAHAGEHGLSVRGSTVPELRTTRRGER